MTMYKWSQTAASNDVSDSTINWLENQAPSTLNNSARALMAAAAKYRDDIAGSITTGGTSTAYTATSNQVITANQDKFRISLILHTDCGATPTLSVDAQTARAMVPYHGGTFAAADMKGGGVYSFVYNNANSEWVADGFFGAFLTTAANASLTNIQALAGTTGVLRKTAANTFSLDDGTTYLIFEKDNSGNVLTTGVMGESSCPFTGTITGVFLLADQSGSAVVDIWKQTYASYPPTVTQTITAAALPTLSSALKYTDTTLTGWTTAVTAGDIFRFNLNSVTTCTRLTLILKIKRFI